MRCEISKGRNRERDCPRFWPGRLGGHLRQPYSFRYFWFSSSPRNQEIEKVIKRAIMFHQHAEGVHFPGRNEQRVPSIPLHIHKVMRFSSKKNSTSDIHGLTSSGLHTLTPQRHSRVHQSGELAGRKIVFIIVPFQKKKKERKKRFSL